MKKATTWEKHDTYSNTNNNLQDMFFTMKQSTELKWDVW